MPINDIGDGLPVTWNDAEVFGNLDSPEALAALGTEVDILYGGSSKQARGTWFQMRGPLVNLVETHLSRHKVKREKDGPAIVFAKGRPTGKFHSTKEGVEIPIGGRAKGDIEEISFAAFDIDNGEALDVVIERLQSLGYFAIMYTTYSHGKAESQIDHPMFIEEGRGSEVFYSQLRLAELPNPRAHIPTFENGVTRMKYTHDPINKYRILIPLEQPFQLLSEDGAGHERKCQEWRDRLVNFANKKLRLSIDESGCDVNRLFFTPRHKPGDENSFMGVFAGRKLPTEEMPFDVSSERPRKKRTPWPIFEKSGNTTIIGTGLRPVLSDGFDLIDWYRDWATKFQVRELFDLLQWDFGSNSKVRGEARIMCPRDHLHSSQGDTSGCWVKDGTGKNAFVIHCHHQTCAAFRSLDQLVDLERVVVLPDQFETFSELLCDPALYEIEDDTPPPNRQRYLRWDPEEKTDAPATGSEEVDQ